MELPGTPFQQPWCDAALDALMGVGTIPVMPGLAQPRKGLFRRGSAAPLGSRIQRPRRRPGPAMRPRGALDKGTPCPSVAPGVGDAGETLEAGLFHPAPAVVGTPCSRVRLAPAEGSDH